MSIIEMQSKRKTNFASVAFDYLRFISPSLIALAAIVQFLTFNNYSLISYEALLFFFGALLATTFICYLSGKVSQHLKIVVIAALLTLYLDFHVNDMRARSIAIAFCMILPSTWFFKRHIDTILATVFSVLIVSILAFPGAKIRHHVASEKNPDIPLVKELPPIVHLILDEHIGIEGIPVDIPLGIETKQLLIKSYIDNGFRLYGNAYSEYYSTYNSISNALNFASSDIDAYFVNMDVTPKRLKKNYYFQLLGELGYRIKIYQSDYMDFSNSNGDSIVSVYEYAANTVQSISQLVDIDQTEKAKFLANNFLVTLDSIKYVHIIYRKLRKFANKVGVDMPVMHRGISLTGPIPTTKVFNKIIRDLEKQPFGTVYFAHLLIPHYPYVYNKECGIRPKVSDWFYQFHEVSAVDRDKYRDRNNPIRKKLYNLYFHQVQCLNNQLDRIFTALKEKEIFKEAIIVIHGDHGSRLQDIGPLWNNRHVLTDVDLKDAFSTLFAIKSKKVKPGYDLTSLSIKDLLLTAVDKNPNKETVKGVFLQTAPGVPMKRLPFPKLNSLGSPQ